MSEQPDWSLESAQAYAADLFTGQRTRLRGVQDGDVDSLIRWRLDPLLDVLQADAINPVSETRARENIVAHASTTNSADRRGFAVATLPDADGSTTLLGLVTLRAISAQHRSAEFGIALGPQSGGKGYGLDATRLMVRYGFRELGLHRIQLGAWAFNVRALATYRKAGFVEEGRRRDVVFHDGRWHDEVIMSVLETDPVV